MAGGRWRDEREWKRAINAERTAAQPPDYLGMVGLILVGILGLALVLFIVGVVLYWLAW